MTKPFLLHRPDAPAPLLYDSPHSGREVPADWDCAQPPLVLRRGEDAYLDELLAPAFDHGVTLLLARVPRSYIDLNRAADDIDPDLLETPWPGANPTSMSARGLGLIRRLIVPGAPIYARKLRAAEIQARLDGIYHPYHQALADELHRLQGRFGHVWHVDWHSMKSRGNAMTPDGPGAVRPDMMVGDLDGTSAGSGFSRLVVRVLGDLGFSVSYNALYKGAEILRRHGRPAEGVHSLQIEINRGLYLDETLVAKTAGFATLREKLARFSQALAGAAAAAPA